MGTSSETDRRETMLAALAEMELHQSEIASGMVEAILEAVPQYEASPDPKTVEDLTAHVQANVNAFFLCSRLERPPTSEDLSFVHRAVENRMAQGVPLDIVLHSFRIGQQYLWEWVKRWAESGDVGPEVAISLALPTMQYADRASSEFTEVYVRLEQQFLASRGRAESQFLSAAIAGQRPPSRAITTLKNVFPVDGSGNFLVVVVTGLADDLAETIRQKLLKIAQADPFISAITMTEERDLVALLSIRPTATDLACEKLARGFSAVAERTGVGLRAGISVRCERLAEVPAGFAEARNAASHAETGETIMLPTRAAVDRISLAASSVGDPDRLIPDKLREFVRADSRKGATLIETLIAYVNHDLNARRTAKALFVHPNTVLYRLRTVSARTGLDYRRASDLLDLVVAIRVLGLSLDA